MRAQRYRPLLVLVAACCAALTGCGRGGAHASLPAGIPGTGAGLGNRAVASAPATFVFRYPKASAASARKRVPKYLSSATASVTLTVTGTKSHGTTTDIFANVPAALTAQQSANFANVTGNPSTPGQCGSDPGNASNIMCTAVFQLPVGDNTVTIASWDAAGGGGNKLSQQITTLWTQQGVANTYNVSLDANAATLSVRTAGGFCSGTGAISAGQTISTVGTSSMTFNVSYTDAATKTIAAPGLPVLSVNGHTDDNSGMGYSDPGNLNVKVNQVAQSYTLHSTTGSGTAPVAVSATHPSGDGLTFTHSLNHNFQTGPAPQGSLLAAIEQTAGGGREIDFYTLNTATNAFSVPSPASLTNRSNDVDVPNDIVFDSPAGDLLIANGGAGGSDAGNFACVPPSAITTGADVATVLTTNVNDPKSLAFGTDASVALANLPNSAAVHMAVFVLNGAYTPAAATRDITDTDYSGLGSNGVVALPTTPQNPAGSFAASITNGSTTSHIVIKHPDGTTQQIDDAKVVKPSLAFDPQNAQIVSASDNGTSSYLTFFSPTGALIKQFLIADTGCYANGATPYAGCPPNTASATANMNGNVVAASSSGYVAVGGLTGGGAEVQIYGNTSTRGTVGGPIPYDARTTAGGSTFVYGNTTVVHALRWITGTKLLVSLEANGSGKQGLYLYDVNQPVTTPCTCFDRFNHQFADSPKEVGFQATTNVPLSAAYRP